jgi:uncharacterized protein YndB with AHSA1/START domain
MTKDVQSARKLELQIDVNAPVEEIWKAITEAEGIASWFAPIAKVSKPGVDGEVTFAWSEEMSMTSRVDVWEPNRRVRWIDDPSFMGPGTALAVEFQLESAGGKTRVRLIQSGFGESEGWDDFFEGTQTGWTYFLYNLRLYVERHLGKKRHMISDRIQVPARRHAAWNHIVAAVTGVAPDRVDSIQVGSHGQISLGAKPTPAVVELAIPDKGLALRLPDLDNAVLFIELEGGGDSFHTGWWLSVYDAARAKELETTAKQTFRKIHDTLPAT